ncbi:acid protease [Flagellimonas aquimarina]|uniref:Acid protease n=2 Tax=Flagellimonas aquimarina TaxID=2201895 RepID=A0A316KX43_9FLAO|nr:acid protease [Allomuricauda koreensis]
MKNMNKKSFLTFSILLIVGLGSNIWGQSEKSTNTANNPLNQFLSNAGYVELKMHKLPSGHLHLVGILNGIQVNFLLDTGASGTVIDEKNKDKFKMESQESDRLAAGAGGGSMQMQISENNNLILGALHINDKDLMMMNLDHVNQAFERLGLEPVDGVIGADILTDYKAIIDYVNLSLYVKS